MKYLCKLKETISPQLLALLTLSGILLFVFTIPYAVALRKLLLVMAFLLSLNAFVFALRQKQNELNRLLMVYALLQIWMLYIAFFVADQAIPSLSEWKGQWLTTVLALIIGVGLASMLINSRLRKPISAITLTVVVPVALLVLVNDAMVLYDMFREGRFITHHSGISDHTANISYAIALLEPLLVADILSRIAHRRSLLPFPLLVNNILLVLMVFALVAASSRNGLLNILLAFILGGLVMLSELRKVYSAKKVAATLLIGMLFIAGYVVIAVKSDPRWERFLETVPIAWDIDRDTRWLDSENLPLTPSGDYVDASAYNRIAWAHEAWRMLLAHPWGTEISRETFQRLEIAKYGHAGMAHSHNGWLDFGLNFGLPGLAILATFLFLLARIGWYAWRMQGEPLGFALMLLVIMFAFRALFDSIFRNHMIEQFILVASLLAGALAITKNRKTLQNEK